MHALAGHEWFGQAFVITVTELRFADDTATGVFGFTLDGFDLGRDPQMATRDGNILLQVEPVEIPAFALADPVAPVGFIQGSAVELVGEQEFIIIRRRFRPCGANHRDGDNKQFVEPGHDGIRETGVPAISP